MVCTLTHKRCLPADRYLISVVSYASRTKILRLRLRMTMRAGRKERNAVCRLISDFYRLIPAPILRRLRRHLLPKKEGLKLRRIRHLPLERQRTQPFYTTRRRRRPQPAPSGAPLFSKTAAIPQPSDAKRPSNLRTLRPKGPVKPKNLFSNPLNPLFPCVMMEVSFFRGR